MLSSELGGFRDAAGKANGSEEDIPWVAPWIGVLSTSSTTAAAESQHSSSCAFVELRAILSVSGAA